MCMERRKVKNGEKSPWDNVLPDQFQTSLRTADAFPVVASLPPKNFSEGEKRRPEMRLRFAG